LIPIRTVKRPSGFCRQTGSCATSAASRARTYRPQSRNMSATYSHWPVCSIQTTGPPASRSTGTTTETTSSSGTPSTESSSGASTSTRSRSLSLAATRHAKPSARSLKRSTPAGSPSPCSSCSPRPTPPTSSTYATTGKSAGASGQLRSSGSSAKYPTLTFSRPLPCWRPKPAVSGHCRREMIPIALRASAADAPTCSCSRSRSTSAGPLRR
jgi:polyhydroxyalkanoate synthase subunit PhaC